MPTLPPIETKVIALGVTPKKQGLEERTLTQQRVGQCYHRHGFILDESLEHVLCSACNAQLSPMWVLKQIAYQETQYHNTSARYQDEMKRLAERSKTKCEHCKQMTRISQR